MIRAAFTGQRRHSMGVWDRDHEQLRALSTSLLFFGSFNSGSSPSIKLCAALALVKHALRPSISSIVLATCKFLENAQSYTTLM
jgi:hypothetical protein